MSNRVEACVFDWAGTILDHGSLAPMGVFVRAFREFGVEIAIDEARQPMGKAKREHIQALVAMPRVNGAWKARHGKAPGEADVDRIYEVFVPLNVSVVADFATLIDGAASTVAALRARGIKIGSSTGYTREIMAPLLPLAAKQGYAPDSLVCAGDLARGRPAPLMIYKGFLDLDVSAAWKVVKIDDTEPGIEEGLNGGCWTVGVALSGNAFGLSKEDTAKLSPAEHEARSAAAYAKLSRCGAHFVIDSVADLGPVIDEIEGALARGERP